MLQRTTMAERPERINIDDLPEGGQYILLHDNAEQVDVPAVDDEPPQKKWECDEVAFKLPAERVQTAESIESDFNSWWTYGISWKPGAIPDPTLEQRVTDLEAALLAFMGV